MISRLGKFMVLPFRMAMRCNEIALVFSRYAVLESFATLGLEVGKRGLRLARVPLRQGASLDGVFGKKLAKALIELGPTFIKLGQMFASRPDVVGDRFADSLKVLFDRVPPMPYGEVRRILKRELGREKLSEAFRSIEKSPIAAASLSQIHRAVLKDGTVILLKIQRKNVSKVVKLDLLILQSLVRSARFVYPALNQMFEDFSRATQRELDYREEAKNIERFKKNHRSLFSTPEVVFPRHFPDLTTKHVLAMEPLHGKRVYEITRGTTVARKVASLGLSSILEQIFDHGFFHADPHAGNLFFLEDEGRLGFVDLGLVGQLDPRDKQKFLKVLLSVLNRDKERLARALFDLGIPSTKTRFVTFEKDVHELIDEFQKQGFDNVKMETMLARLLSTSRHNGIHIPHRYTLMIRSCLIIEGVAKSLDPNISLIKVATPIVAKSLLKTYSPLAFIRRMF